MEISKKEQILDLYFNKGYRQIDIAEQMGISRQLVSRIISRDERYKKPVEKVVKFIRTKSDYRISIPNGWVEKLDINDDRKAKIKIVNDKQIIIEKYENNTERNKKMEQEIKYERQTIAIAEKIYNDVLDFVHHSQSLTTYSLVKRFKIGYTTAEYLIDKLDKEGLLEYRYGIYWVKSNN